MDNLSILISSYTMDAEVIAVLNDSKDVGERIRLLREHERLTQKDLADKLSITYQAISKWEKGECYPDIAQIVALSELFGVSIDSLLKSRINTQSKKHRFEVYESIISEFTILTLHDVRVAGETRIVLKIENKSEVNLRLSPKMFMLFAEDKVAIKPAESNVIKYNYSSDEDDLIGTKLKHEIPEFIPPNKDALATLVFSNPGIDVFGFEHTFLTFYPCITNEHTNLHFNITKMYYDGLEKPKFTDNVSSLEIKNAIDFYLAKENVQAIMDLVFFKPNTYEEPHHYKNIQKPSISYGTHDEILRTIFINKMSEIEKLCAENKIAYNYFIKQHYTFMNDEIIRFVARMWFRYGGKLLDWTIPFLNNDWVKNHKELLMEKGPNYLLPLYNCMDCEEVINNLIMEILETKNFVETMNLITAVGNHFSVDLREHYLLRFPIENIDQLVRLKSYIRKETLERLKADFINRAVG